VTKTVAATNNVPFHKNGCSCKSIAYQPRGTTNNAISGPQINHCFQRSLRLGRCRLRDSLLRVRSIRLLIALKIPRGREPAYHGNNAAPWLFN
jgi:hypothetical protein